MKSTNAKTNVPAPADAMFELKSSNYPDPIWVDGSGKLENKRLIVSIKLSNKLAQYVKDDQISFTILKRKELDLYGRTHSILINQSKWPVNKPFNRNWLTIADGNDNALHFTLTMEQMQTLAYVYAPPATKIPAQYIKLEIVSNGMQYGVFRFCKEACPEVESFRNADKLISTTPPQGKVGTAAEDHIFEL